MPANSEADAMLSRIIAAFSGSARMPLCDCSLGVFILLSTTIASGVTQAVVNRQ